LGGRSPYRANGRLLHFDTQSGGAVASSPVAVTIPSRSVTIVYSAHLFVFQPPFPIPCPAIGRIRNSHPQSFRCLITALAIVCRSSSDKARRSRLIGERGRAKPMSKAR